MQRERPGILLHQEPLALIVSGLLFAETDLMNNSLLLGIWRYMLRVPRRLWQKQVSSNARHNDAQLSFMQADHHLVRNFVVRDLPRVSAPLSPEIIALKLNLPIDRVITILDDLEKHMTFLFRNEDGAVVWAYPVTVARTPHKVTFTSGEQLYAA
jgi:hypothetical protein